MKKMIVFIIAVVGIVAAEAGPNLFGIPLPERPRPAARRPAPPPPHDRHHDDKALAGGVLHAVGAVAGLVDHTVNGPETVVVQQPTTVVAAQPVIVQQPTTVVSAQPAVVQQTTVVEMQSAVVQPVSATTGPVVVPANNVVLRHVVAGQPAMTIATPGEPALETVYVPATYTPPPPYCVKPIVIPLRPLRSW